LPQEAGCRSSGKATRGSVPGMEYGAMLVAGGGGRDGRRWYLRRRRSVGRARVLPSSGVGER
jgi:hypothetical protein